LFVIKCCQRAQHVIRGGSVPGDSTWHNCYLEQWSDGHRLRSSVCWSKSYQICHCTKHIRPWC